VIHSINYTTKSILYFNNAEKSVFKTFKNDKYNDSIPRLISSESDNKTILINKDTSKKPVFFLDRKNNILITKVWKFRKNYVLTEDIPLISWEVKQEYKTVSELNCQKAVGSFRGRNYIVWFTEDIPINLGPWKLSGLPGLILEAEDDKGIFFYRATKVKLNSEIPTIDLPKIEDAISLKEFVSEIEPKKFEDLNKRLQAKMDRSISLDTSLGPVRSSQKELVYEWEIND
ncbi:MAG: GLPGLI family protein, partial [Bacteroidota bacterium]